jgi:Arc/MetJ family transcription regulator
MKTLIDIPQGAIGEVQKIYKLRTKKEAVVFALNEVIRYKKLRDLADLSGTFKDSEIMSQADLKKMRRRDTSRIFSIH